MEQTNTDELILRVAVKSDASLIHHFIKQLACYEKMEVDFTGTIEDIEKNIFDLKMARVVLAYYQDQPVGFCLYFTSFSTFLCKGGIYLEDLFIDEAYRHRGFGKAMFHYLTQIAKENNYERIEWVCLDWNASAIKFYEHVIGAMAQKEWIRFRLDSKGINALLIDNNHHQDN